MVTTPAGTTRGAAVEFCVAAVRRHDSTAGRLARASQVCKELLQARLAELKEQRSLAAEQAAQALRDRKRDLILSCCNMLRTARRGRHRLPLYHPSPDMGHHSVPQYAESSIRTSQASFDAQAPPDCPPDGVRHHVFMSVMFNH